MKEDVQGRHVGLWITLIIFFYTIFQTFYRLNNINKSRKCSTDESIMKIISSGSLSSSTFSVRIKISVSKYLSRNLHVLNSIVKMQRIQIPGRHRDWTHRKQDVLICRDKKKKRFGRRTCWQSRREYDEKIGNMLALCALNVAS